MTSGAVVSHANARCCGSLLRHKRQAERSRLPRRSTHTTARAVAPAIIGEIISFALPSPIRTFTVGAWISQAQPIDLIKSPGSRAFTAGQEFHLALKTQKI